ncbi:hypothetical protein Tco_0040246 [Tanacetum coccineum]
MMKNELAQIRLEYKQPEEQDKHGLLDESTQQLTKGGVAKHLGVEVIQQQNGLVKETNVTLLAKVLQGDEFEVEPQDGHTFEVKPNVACEVISKWKAGLKDDMDARSDVYVLSNGCKKCSDDSDGYYWESTPVGSQEYQMVCTRLDIASADVGMLDKFDRGLQTDVQVFVDFDYAMAAYMTLTGAWKKEIWLKGLLAESGYELSLVAGIATGALVKGGSRSEVPAQVEGAAYRY